ncbi:MAG: nitronate monooxygenase, partial [Acidimicrobiia bacterium]|nr:nitronate monooxygenase [Acidimicrobiia bacterium]
DATKKHFTRFDPRSFFEKDPPRLPRPKFLAIVASHVLATMLSRAEVPPDGFVVEGPTAGGHNAPPRAKGVTETGEPLYGERDVVDLGVLSDIGKPFWLAGSQASPHAVREALNTGASGVQVGTAFAFCAESDMREDIKADVLKGSAAGTVKVFTDPEASPTGFPFKIVQMDGTLSDRVMYEKRERICDLGYLRTPYETSEGKVKWRCAAEPVIDFTKKGGMLEETNNRQCLCNALMANIGLAQLHDGQEQEVLVTAGDDASFVARFLAPGAETYSAADVIANLLAGV